ncbi:7-cyano-7-deazaguanine synthase QueC [Helicobacter sp. 11S03491-1]|uniref:7-cyano-7-deazaguanine synthase QueC n=1 Tax=Helicobacter sp. 11S03491-1 TaxID=1476196 RepID=UPI000BA68076|nr:7-cyano-7-deazaguanine synthase QueC [Helicobacter sp. 11S03491-1]PAF43340.1 7-cyano-7-deazaguanine synthase QueC [Helicobacter sp. 11S03491-1]
MGSKCVVSFSGGQDSTTTSVWAKNKFDEVILIGFDYNQKHKIELTQAKLIAQKLNLPFHLIKIDFFAQIVESALLQSNTQNVNSTHPQNHSLPASFVPNRNAIFITIAHSFAQKIAADTLILGVSQQDYSGYPDCREEFIKSIENTLNLGSDTSIKILTPLMYLDKAQEFKLARDLGVLDLILEDTHTCYNGVRNKREEWGYGCGECPACKLRKNAWEKYLKAYQSIQNNL